MATSLTLPKWHDLHAHFRQGANLPSYVAAHLGMGCAGALAMPNTRPPVSRVCGPNSAEAWSIATYRGELLAAGGNAFEQLIVPLYLTAGTTAEMIREGAESGVLRACKYYPPHGTTNAEHGVPMEQWIGGEVFRAMEERDVVLCIHGETHGLSGPDFLDRHRSAEQHFYRETMPRLAEAHPRLRMVCEHITTAEAAAFVAETGERVAATVTPQHLLFTLGDLIQGLKFHLYCLPAVKFEEDRAALREAVTRPGQGRFFAGTDSAPHTDKLTECGCAAGCFTGGCAPQLYATAFEESGLDLGTEEGAAALRAFLCENGPRFYGFAPSAEHFTLIRTRGEVPECAGPEGKAVTLVEGLGMELEWTIAGQD